MTLTVKMWISPYLQMKFIHSTWMQSHKHWLRKKPYKDTRERHGRNGRNRNWHVTKSPMFSNCWWLINLLTSLLMMGKFLITNKKDRTGHNIAIKWSPMITGPFSLSVKANASHSFSTLNAFHRKVFFSYRYHPCIKPRLSDNLWQNITSFSAWGSSYHKDRIHALWHSKLAPCKGH